MSNDSRPSEFVLPFYTYIPNEHTKQMGTASRCCDDDCCAHTCTAAMRQSTTYRHHDNQSLIPTVCSGSGGTFCVQSLSDLMILFTHNAVVVVLSCLLQAENALVMSNTERHKLFRHDNSSFYRRPRRTQESKLPVINEVLFLPNPLSPHVSERRTTIEIYRPDTSFDLSGCVVENDAESFRVVLPNRMQSVDAPYFTIKRRATQRKEQVLKRSRGILWLKEMELQVIDGLALFCNDEMVDFLAWGRDGIGPNGDLYVQAVENEMWTSTNDFVETGIPENDGQFVIAEVRPEFFPLQELQPGDSLGRDGLSTDTDGVPDWQYSGGADSRRPTPSERNKEYSALPLINEVLFLADPESRKFYKRRMFLEIYRKDTSYSLVGCSLLNSDGSFRVTFDESFQKVNDEYFTIKERSTQTEAFRLSRKNGVLWMRDFDLDETDGLGLFCDARMIDYVMWGQRFGPIGYLPDLAVSTQNWGDAEDYVATGRQILGGTYISRGMQKGDSIGRNLNSTDVNNSSDWSLPGGTQSRIATPNGRNQQYMYHPIINEVLWRPRPGSSDFSRRRVFVEIYLRDTSYSLNGCTLVNSDGSFRVDFDEELDDVDVSYFTVKQKSRAR